VLNADTECGLGSGGKLNGLYMTKRECVWQGEVKNEDAGRRTQAKGHSLAEGCKLKQYAAAGSNFPRTDDCNCRYCTLVSTEQFDKDLPQIVKISPI
jgi:hypothetical protein